MIYSAFFYIYSTGHDKNALRFRIGIVGAVATAISAYAQFEDRSAIEYRLGVMLLVLLIGLMTSPLLGLVNIFALPNLWYVILLVQHTKFLAENDPKQKHRRFTAVPAPCVRYNGFIYVDVVCALHQ